MYYIVGDIGNTSTRICLLNEKYKIAKSIIFDTKNIFIKKYINYIFKNLLKRTINNKILFSSVVPKAFKMIKNYFKTRIIKLLKLSHLI